MNKKIRNNFSAKIYSTKPKKWKFISTMIYSSEVVIYDNDNIIGTLEIKYKLLTRTTLDIEWLHNMFYNIFDEIPKYYTNEFKRDGSGIIYIQGILLSEETFKRCKRELKLKRILKFDR